jgi:2-C-methyl-D-erythritol 2,4-cyclodiphosphate synthase
VGLRIGQGFDAHRFSVEDGRILRLALLEWPDEPALEGHSDGDVIVHALVDALTSAAGWGDIGTLFGTGRAETAGAASSIFLNQVAARLSQAGFVVEHATVQLIGQRPRLAARRGEAERALTAALGAPVSLSATTTDGMGFTGRGEGLAAIASCLLRDGQ